MSAGDFSFSTCLSLLEEYFSDAASLESAFSDAAITQADAYFNLGAFGFDDGKRVGIFQRTEQFSDIVSLFELFSSSSLSRVQLVVHLCQSQCAHAFTHRCRQQTWKQQLYNFAWQLLWWRSLVIATPELIINPFFRLLQIRDPKIFLSSGMPQGEIVGHLRDGLDLPLRTRALHLSILR